MSDVVIKAEGLGKKYLIGHKNERESYTALRDVLSRNVKSVLNKTRQVLNGQQLLAGDTIEEFWALRDVDFEIKRGDRVGIIGRNGAGKSTLLKVLSRITEPSKGRVEIHGRVASLLEVGTGFHPELTGRENIFLNGAILGMTRAEIKKKFDEIVDFAGVEKFLDTPVKRYSSGMYVRLAFAVAAHMEPEILVVDEVLAVGDAEFQKKCMGKMEDVSKNDGRTVLFVSHNISAIQQLCNCGFLFENGLMKAKGQIPHIVEMYTNIGSNLYDESVVYFDQKVKRNGSGEFRFEWVNIKDDEGHLRNQFSIGNQIVISFAIKNLSEQKKSELAIQIKASDGTPILHMMSRDSQFMPIFNKELEVFTVTLLDIRLFPGIYSISLTSANSSGVEVYDNIEEATTFTITDGGKYTTRALPKAAGLFFLTPDWKQNS